MRQGVPEVRPRRRRDIHQEAERLVSAVSPATLRAESPFPIDHICEFQLEELFDVALDVQDLPPDREGSLNGNDLILSTDVYEELRAGAPRARFTASHELGHVALHRHELAAINDGRRGAVALHRRGSLPAFRDPEWQANEYAGAVLMPGDAVRLLASRATSLAHLIILMTELLGVSRHAAQTRIDVMQKTGELH